MRQVNLINRVCRWAAKYRFISVKRYLKIEAYVIVWRFNTQNAILTVAALSSNSTGTSFPVTSSRTCWRRRQLPRDKLVTTYEEVSDTPDRLDMSRWSESHQLPRNFLVTSWRLPRNICYGEVTGKLVPSGI